MDIKKEEVLDVIEEYEKYAKQHGFKLNENRKILEAVVSGLLKKERELGFRYCPCRVVSGDKEKDKKIICPCEFHKQELEDKGYCHCRLFVKPDVLKK